MPELRANVTFATTTESVELLARVGIVDSPPGHMAADVDFDTAAALLLQPTLGLVAPGDTVENLAVIPSWQVAGVDPGVFFTDDDIKIGADLDSCARSWSVTLVASSGTRASQDFTKNPLGYELDVGGPPPGFEVPIDFALTLLGRGDPAPAITIPLLTGGYADPGGSSKRTFNDEAHTMELSGGGRASLFSSRQVDLKLPANHGNTHGELVILLMQAALVPDELIGIDPTIGARRTVALDIRCAALWPLIHEILRPLGLVVMDSPEDGVFRTVSFAVGDGEPAVMTIGPKDIVASDGVTTSASALGATCYSVTGERLQDPASGSGTSSGTVTTPVVVSIFRDGFTLPVAVASQSTGGAISSTGSGPFGPPTDGVLVNRVTVEATTVDGCPGLTKTTVENFNNPPAARYVAVGTPTGEPRGYRSGFFFGTIPSVDDSQQMKTYQSDRFQIFSEEWSIPIFEDRTDEDGADFKVRVGTTGRFAGWRNIEASIKNRGAVDNPWELENYTTGRFLSPSFAGRLFDRDRYFAGPNTPDASFPSGSNPTYPSFGFVVTRYLKVVNESREVDDCRYETAVETETIAYDRRQGQTQLYADGSSSPTSSLVGLSSSIREDRVDQSNGFLRVRTGTDIEGDALDTEVVQGASQGLPSAETCSTASLDRDRQESFTVNDICLERLDGAGDPAVNFNAPEELSSDFVETEAEARSWALLELALLISPDVELSLNSPNPTLDAGKNVTLNLPEKGYPGIVAKIVQMETTIGAKTTQHTLICRINLLE